MDIIYRANDGTEFDNEEGCVFYEKKRVYDGEKLPMLLNADMEMINYSNVDEFYDLLENENYKYCYIENDEQASLFYDYLDDFDQTAPPCEEGLWYYDDEIGEFVNFISKRSEMNKLYEAFRGTIVIENLHRVNPGEDYQKER